MNIGKIKKDVKVVADDCVLSILGAYLIYLVCMFLPLINILLYYVEPGFTLYITQVANRKKAYLPDLFFYTNYKWNYLYTGFLKKTIILLNTLLLFIPGLIKKYQYSLVPFILMDRKYNNVRGMDCLKLSKKIMTGHLIDCFILDASFIPYHIVSIFTLGILELYIIPYQTACKYKLLYEIKKSYTGESHLMESNVTYTPVGKIYKRKSHPLPKSRDEEGNFIPVFCLKCGSRLREGTHICDVCGYEYENDPDAKF